ncbi:hypothetical protein SLEP1_g53240 [Rubroshorea leprosula]|uniref:Uncharacterized protein n=1 Tax=Rubroshorea leprosula TaxID=152421 RepID=A0AAV5MBM7_9ROSI|nr:hypothetical protein SLEP1_g53240 [Rubroshorea leprosula]
MVNTRFVRAGSQTQPSAQGQAQCLNNIPPHILNLFPPIEHAEGGDENQPHNSAHNAAPIPNQEPQLVRSTDHQHAPTLSESQGQSHMALAQQPLPDDATRRLDSLEKMVAEQRCAPPPHHNTTSIPHPLYTNITLEPYPTGFKIPQLETYDGTKDPDDHLHAFYSCMQAQNASDALMCKIFPFTLRGNAQTWYYSLPPRSISSYTEMASAFVTKFSSRRLIRKTTFELMRVMQRDGESLKNYMSKFNDAVLEVCSFDQAMGIAAVIQGLNHERFRDSIIKHPIATFNEMRARAKADEDNIELRSNVDLHIEIQKTELDHGHTTEECNSLRSKLESLSQKGMLNEYIQRTKQLRFVREQGPQPQRSRNVGNRQGVGYQQAPPPLPPSARIIHMIIGGLEAGGLSSKQRKLYVREVQRGLINIGSAPNIMYYHCFESLGLDLALLQRYDDPIYGFNNQLVQVEGVLTLDVAFGSGQTYVTPSIWFLVIKMASSFNAVIGRPTSTEIRAMVSQSHLCMKFLTPMGVAALRDNQEMARHCYITSVTRLITRPQKGKDQTSETISKEVHDNQQVKRVEVLDNRPKDETRVDMPGISTSISQHKLSTDPLKKPVAQKRRFFGGKRLKVIKEEVKKLLQTCFIRRVNYCEWVTNPVLVKKANVEAASRNETLSLLDAYSGYHQVPMTLEDEEKTSFYAGDEIYCYVMIPFGLKNTGATYQNMVTIVFRAQIGRNLEVYINDIVVKSLKAEDHLADLDETFNNLRKNKMRLNPTKCIFGVESENFLGFMVSRRGIEVNLEKIKAIAEMKPPRSVKDVQRLTGRVAALQRFISK